MLSNHLEIRPMSGTTGAEIFGVDVSDPLPDTTIKRIRGALATYGVVVFRDQSLDSRTTYRRRAPLR